MSYEGNTSIVPPTAFKLVFQKNFLTNTQDWSSLCHHMNSSIFPMIIGRENDPHIWCHLWGSDSSRNKVSQSITRNGSDVHIIISIFFLSKNSCGTKSRLSIWCKAVLFNPDEYQKLKKTSLHSKVICTNTSQNTNNHIKQSQTFLLKIVPPSFPSHNLLGGDSTNAGNYRPLSVLPIFSKIFETAVYKQLYTYLEPNNILCEHQYGFRKHKSTEQALLNHMQFMYDSIDSDNFVISVFLDFKKAFDSVDHKFLLSKLAFYGIRGVSHEWLKSYYSKRNQISVIDGITHEQLRIEQLQSQNHKDFSVNFIE